MLLLPAVSKGWDGRVGGIVDRELSVELDTNKCKIIIR
jgi:hypothetical protein